MAKRLEEALYSNANSLDEYRDVNTLKSRLQQYAMSVGNRNAQANRTPMNPQHGQLPQQNFGPGISQQQQRIMGGVQQNVNTRPPGVGMAANSNAGQYFLQQDPNITAEQSQQQAHMQQMQEGQDVVNGNEMSEED